MNMEQVDEAEKSDIPENLRSLLGHQPVHEGSVHEVMSFDGILERGDNILIEYHLEDKYQGTNHLKEIRFMLSRCLTPLQRCVCGLQRVVGIKS